MSRKGKEVKKMFFRYSRVLAVVSLSNPPRSSLPRLWLSTTVTDCLPRTRSTAYAADPRTFVMASYRSDGRVRHTIPNRWRIDTTTTVADRRPKNMAEMTDHGDWRRRRWLRRWWSGQTDGVEPWRLSRPHNIYCAVRTHTLVQIYILLSLSLLLLFVDVVVIRFRYV